MSIPENCQSADPPSDGIGRSREIPAATAGRPDNAAERRTLDSLVTTGGALSAMLITRDGNVIAEAGDTSFFNVTALAALVAGMFAATREVARMLGENHFCILLQQGEKRHIHISLVDEHALLIVVFEDSARIGIIQREAWKAGPQLAGLLREARKPRAGFSEADGLPLTSFKEYVLKMIDQIFEK